MRASVEEADLVLRLTDQLQIAPPDSESLDAWIREAVQATGANPDYVAALRAAPILTDPSRWAALATVAVAVRTGRLLVVDNQDRFIGWAEFNEYADGVGLDEEASRLLYAEIGDFWRGLHPRPRLRSNVGTYLALCASGLTNRREVLRFSSDVVGLRLG